MVPGFSTLAGVFASLDGSTFSKSGTEFGGKYGGGGSADAANTFPIISEFGLCPICHVLIIAFRLIV